MLVALAAVWFFGVSYDAKAPIAEHLYRIGPFETEQECRAARLEWEKISFQWTEADPDDDRRSFLILECTEHRGKD